MDLIDRYLIAVRRHLPRSLQDDVIPELKDSLRSEAEDQEQALGRPLTEAEQAALLRKRGHPWLMAGRYLPQQQLIGPALFPYYRQTLILVLCWVVLPLTLIGGAMAAVVSDRPGAVWSSLLGAAWNAAIYAIGIVTVVFAVLERERVRITALDSWNPEHLPEPQRGRVVPRSETVVGLVVSLTLLAWWIGLVRVPDFIYYDGTPARIVPAPVWAAMFWPILGLLVASIGVSVVDLVRPWRTFAISAVDIAIGIGGAVVFGLVVRHGRYVEVVADPQYADRATRADYWLNAGLGWTFIVLMAVMLLDVLYELWLVSRARDASAVA